MSYTILHTPFRGSRRHIESGANWTNGVKAHIATYFELATAVCGHRGLARSVLLSGIVRHEHFEDSVIFRGLGPNLGKSPSLPQNHIFYNFSALRNFWQVDESFFELK